MIDPYKSVVAQGEEFLIGRSFQIELCILAVLSNGHCLIEDLPGVGKTTLVHLASKLLGMELNRIQFTSDLLPSDITGAHVLKNGDFVFKKGPIFGEALLADELNRAHPKTQSALLQAMEELEVSIDDQTFGLSKMFTVFATQNPLDQVGTNRLPESQLDRFAVSFSMELPTKEEEKKILLMSDLRSKIKNLDPVVTIEDIEKHRQKALSVHVSEEILDYVLNFLETLRSYEGNYFHISPRAGKDWIRFAKSLAYLDSKDFVIPEYLQKIAPNIFAHRLNAGIDLERGREIVKNVLEQVSV